MARVTVTLDEENAEYIDEMSDKGDFENESTVVNEAVRRMRTDVECRGGGSVAAYEPLDEVHQELREERDEDGHRRERASVLSKLKPW